MAELDVSADVIDTMFADGGSTSKRRGICRATPEFPLASSAEFARAGRVNAEKRVQLVVR